MQYGIFLIDKAAEKCGSFYALAKRMDVSEGNISAIRKGRRKLPLAWVYELATIAEVDPAWALKGATEELARSEAKRSRLGKAVAGGAVVMLLGSYGINFPSVIEGHSISHEALSTLYIVSTGAAVLWAVRRWIKRRRNPAF